MSQEMITLSETDKRVLTTISDELLEPAMQKIKAYKRETDRLVLREALSATRDMLIFFLRTPLRRTDRVTQLRMENLMRSINKVGKVINRQYRSRDLPKLTDADMELVLEIQSTFRSISRQVGYSVSLNLVIPLLLGPPKGDE